eukprot:1933390-Rhodomonas_salina.1
MPKELDGGFPLAAVGAGADDVVVYDRVRLHIEGSFERQVCTLIWTRETSTPTDTRAVICRWDPVLPSTGQLSC